MRVVGVLLFLSLAGCGGDISSPNPNPLPYHTTVEPGPNALVTGYRIVAKEGAIYGHMEPGFGLVRQQK